MENRDKDKIEKIVADRKLAHQFYTDNSEVYQNFVEMELKTFQDNHLSKKVKELIAIGISVRINCESCLEWHIKNAVYSGATREEVIESIEVAMEMGGGPATVTARFALSVLDYYTLKINDKRIE
jgi:AhpD family alkylhydroperoxidase